MTIPLPHDPEHSTGFRFDQLAAAFGRVMNSRDWKAPVNAVIAASDRSLVEQAVLWFTHTAPSFVVPEGAVDRLVVTAVGYRSGPAGERGMTPGRSGLEELRLEPLLVSTQ